MSRRIFGIWDTGRHPITPPTVTNQIMTRPTRWIRPTRWPS